MHLRQRCECHYWKRTKIRPKTIARHQIYLPKGSPSTGYRTRFRRLHRHINGADFKSSEVRGG